MLATLSGQLTQLQEQAEEMACVEDIDTVRSFLVTVHEVGRDIQEAICIQDTPIESDECTTLIQNINTMASSVANVEIQYASLLQNAGKTDTAFSSHRVHERLRERGKNIQDYVDLKVHLIAMRAFDAIQ